MPHIVPTHPIPDDFDARVFSGRILEMICFNLNQIYFHFGRKIVVCAESDFEYCVPGIICEVMSLPVEHSSLMPLLEHSVTLASFDEAQTLTLIFDNKHALRLFADPQYESYSITVEAKTFHCVPVNFRLR